MTPRRPTRKDLLIALLGVAAVSAGCGGGTGDGGSNGRSAPSPSSGGNGSSSARSSLPVGATPDGRSLGFLGVSFRLPGRAIVKRETRNGAHAYIAQARYHEDLLQVQIDDAPVVVASARLDEYAGLFHGRIVERSRGRSAGRPTMGAEIVVPHAKLHRLWLYVITDRNALVQAAYFDFAPVSSTTTPPALKVVADSITLPPR